MSGSRALPLMNKKLNLTTLTLRYGSNFCLYNKDSNEDKETILRTVCFKINLPLLNYIPRMYEIIVLASATPKMPSQLQQKRSQVYIPLQHPVTFPPSRSIQPTFPTSIALQNCVFSDPRLHILRRFQHSNTARLWSPIHALLSSMCRLGKLTKSSHVVLEPHHRSEIFRRRSCFWSVKSHPERRRSVLICQKLSEGWALYTPTAASCVICCRRSVQIGGRRAICVCGGLCRAIA